MHSKIVISKILIKNTLRHNFMFNMISNIEQNKHIQFNLVWGRSFDIVRREGSGCLSPVARLAYLFSILNYLRKSNGRLLSALNINIYKKHGSIYHANKDRLGSELGFLHSCIL